MSNATDSRTPVASINSNLTCAIAYLLETQPTASTLTSLIMTAKPQAITRGYNAVSIYIKARVLFAIQKLASFPWYELYLKANNPGLSTAKLKAAKDLANVKTLKDLKALACRSRSRVKKETFELLDTFSQIRITEMVRRDNDTEIVPAATQSDIKWPIEPPAVLT